MKRKRKIANKVAERPAESVTLAAAIATILGAIGIGVDQESILVVIGAIGVLPSIITAIVERVRSIAENAE